MKRRAALPFALSCLLLAGTAPAQPAPTVLPGHAFLVGASSPAVQVALRAAETGSPLPMAAATPQNLATQVLTLIRERRLNPPRAARTLALVLGTVNDAGLLAAGSARRVDANAAAFIAATRVLQHLYPDAGVALQDDLHHHLGTLPGTVAQPTEALAEAVAAQVIAFARQDGADRPHPVTLPRTEGTWTPLPGQMPLEPGWGWVQPIGLTAQTLPQVTPPPAWNTAAFQQSREAFRATQVKLSADDLTLARYWAGGPGTVTPGGMWIETALRLARDAGLNGPDSAAVLALTAVAEHDAFITCWRAKFTFNVARPQGWMGHQFPGWTPNIATPPFPSYPSGHATISGAAAHVLAAAFPTQAAALLADAQAAAYSRVVGGIHWTVDGEGGLDAGRRVAEALLRVN